MKYRSGEILRDTMDPGDSIGFIMGIRESANISYIIQWHNEQRNNQTNLDRIDEIISLTDIFC